MDTKNQTEETEKTEETEDIKENTTKMLTEKQYEFLSKELIKHQQQERITTEQMTEMLKTYQIKEKINYIQVLLIFGAFLVGLGILSFIASNWEVMSKLTKFLLIFLSFLAVNLIGYGIEDKYPKTSRSLIYIGIFIFGAGIFLIGQMFHFGGQFTDAFLLWSIGILPLTLILKDKWAFAFLHILLLVYLNGQYIYEDFPLIMLLFIPFLYLGQKVIKTDWIIFLSNLVTLNFIWYVLDRMLNLEVELVILIFFILGVLLYFIKIPIYSLIFKLQGNLMLGIFGFILTFKEIWDGYTYLEGSIIPYHIFFSIFFVIFLLILIRQENLLSIVVIGLVIFKYYFDTMYDFLHKSIFFIVGGLILLGFGYYFEKKRKNLRREENEK